MNKFTFFALAGLLGCAFTMKAQNHEAVDLGLPSGTCWATTNIGTDKATDTGIYFAWGDVNGHTDEEAWEFSWNNYLKHLGANFTDATGAGTDVDPLRDYLKGGSKYSENGLQGTEFDAATKHWGTSWGTPTKQQLDELRSRCKWTWVQGSGSDLNGYSVKGPNGKTIFMPAAGYYDEKKQVSLVQSYGGYWSSTSSTDKASQAASVYFDDGYVDQNDSYDERFMGLPIRPVKLVATAVENVKTADAVPVAYYDLCGHELNAPCEGVNIVHMSDGTTHKIIK